MAGFLHRHQGRTNLNSLAAPNLCRDRPLQVAVKSPRIEAVGFDLRYGGDVFWG